MKHFKLIQDQDSNVSIPDEACSLFWDYCAWDSCSWDICWYEINPCMPWSEAGCMPWSETTGCDCEAIYDTCSDICQGDIPPCDAYMCGNVELP